MPPTVQERFGTAIGEVGRLWRDRLNQRLKPLGLSQAKWRALLYISRVAGGMTQSELAKMLGIEAPTCTRLVKQLEQSEWLTRYSPLEDGRRKVMQVTTKAREIIIQIDEEVRQLRAETLSKLSDEQASAGLAALAKVRELLVAL